ncbi:YciI family protein [Sphingomonas sp. RS2018]
MKRVDAAPVCIITLTYTAELSAVDALMPAHVDWLRKGFDEGVFLLAGRQVPRVGGVIVSRGTRDAVEAVAATDPFVTGGVATAAVTEIAISLTADAIAPLLA